MKKIMLFALFAIFAGNTMAQDVKFPAIDSSPADIAYFPLSVAKAKDDSKPLIKVVYSRPSKKVGKFLVYLSNLAKYGV
ncbi:hypothetical protein [Pedobacter panaciterrae]